jgi:hypothetical protein
VKKMSELLDPKLIDRRQEEVNGLREVLMQEVADVNDNVKWYATLAIAEIAGLAGYRQLARADGLQFFAIPILLIGLALVVLLLASLLGQEYRLRTAKRTADFRAQVAALCADPDKTPNQAEKELDGLVSARAKELTGVLDRARWLVGVGLGVFLIGSALAAAMLILSELALVVGLGGGVSTGGGGGASMGS